MLYFGRHLFCGATEKTRDAFFITTARGIVIIIPLVLILSRAWAMTGVWLAFVLTEFVVTAITMGVQRARQKKLIISRDIRG
mgnify:FL=1|jgi:Na+-driven multidrug efflux pump